MIAISKPKALVLLGILILGMSGCGKTQDSSVTQTRACQGLESQLAKGQNNADFLSARRSLEDHRMGCDQGVQFMIYLSSALFEDTTNVKPGELIALGNRWCDNHFASEMGKVEGCRTGVSESALYTPTVVAYLAVPGNATAQADSGVAAAAIKASEIVNRLALARAKTIEAQNKITHGMIANAALEKAKTDLKNATSDVEIARTRAIYLKANKTKIFNDLANSYAGATAAVSMRDAAKRRVDPLQTAYDLAKSANDSAFSRKAAAENRYWKFKNGMDSANISAGIARANTISYRNEARDLHDEALRTW